MFAALVVTSILAAAQAEQSDDWDVVADPGGGRVIATAQYSSGVGLQVECVDGQLVVGVTGLPRTREDSVIYRRTRADGQVETSAWSVASDGSTRISPSSARYARLLRRGGVFALSSADGSRSAPGIRLDLPSQARGLDQVLTACGAELVESGDDIQDVTELFLEWPMVEPPSSIFRQHENFQISLVCAIANSRLSACRSDSQAPNDERAGDLVARKANGTRLRTADPQAAEGRTFEFVVTGTVMRRP